MDSVFRKRVEGTIAESLAKRVREAENLDAAEPDLERLRQLVIVNSSLKRHLRDAISYLKDADFVETRAAAEFEKEWKDLGGRSYPAPNWVPTIEGSSAARIATSPRKSDTAFSQLLMEPADIYGKDPQAPWNKVDGEELEGFLDQINPIDGNHVLDPATTQVAWSQLPFYDSVALIRVVDQTWSTLDLIIYYLTDQSNLFRLNGTSPAIHEVNAKAPLKLNEHNVLDYLRFFCFFVRGEEGPFYLAEDLASPYMPTMPDQTVSSIFEGSLRPVTLEGTNEQGHYLCDCLVFYSNALFIANFAVQPTGMVEMLDDEPIAADLPVKIVAPVS